MKKTLSGERYWLLDSVAGWREAHRGREHIALAPADGALILDPLPGRATALWEDEKAWKATGFVCPSALAVDPCGNRLLVTDAATHLVRQIDLATSRVEMLTAIGGEGIVPRALRTPRGIALLRSGIFAVADTGNHRVQIFSSAPHALLQLWDEPGRFRWPWGIAADSCGVLHIVDRGRGLIHRLRRDGRSLPKLGEGRLRAPTRLAISGDGHVAVIDRARAAVLVFLPDHAEPWVNTGVSDPRTTAFDGAGRLYVGDAIGLIHVFQAADGGQYQLIGVGESGVRGEFIDLAWMPGAGLIAIIQQELDGGARVRLWRIDPTGACAANGQFTTASIDSGIERCQWHRVLLDATVPLQTSLEIESSTSDAPDVAPIWKRCLLAGGCDDPDCLVQSERGQYLRLRLIFKSNGVASPAVRSIKTYFPRTSYLQYLPSVYQEDEESRRFLERFLSIFQTGFDNFDRRIDTLWQLFDPNSVPDEHFAWLAAWLGLLLLPDSGWSSEKKREMLRNAIADYRRRGTIDGVQKAVADYAGVPWTRGNQDFKLRRWPALSIAARLDGSVPLWSRHFYQRLQESAFSQIGFFRLTGSPEPAIEPLDWGAHRFTIFFPADPYRVAAARQKVGRVVEREKPLHTEAELCPVLPRFRVGIQAMIGFDTMVAGISHLVLSHVATLGYDTILGCTPAEQQLRAFGTAVRPRIGVSSRLS